MTTFFVSVIMLRFSNAKVAKEESYWAKKNGMLMMIIYLTQTKLKRRIALSIWLDI